MQFKYPKNQDQIELIKAAGSKDLVTAAKAQEIMAKALSPVVKEVLNNVGTASLIYETVEYLESEAPVYPLDLYYDEGQGFVTVTQQGRAGSLATSEVVGVDDLQFTTALVDSAVSMKKNYARFGNLDVASKTITRMTQELLLQQENYSWNVITKALAESSSNGADHVIDVDSANNLGINDFNRLLTLFDDINASFSGGTSIESTYGLTDLFLSPVAMEKIRAMAYQPINTKGANHTTGAADSGVTQLPDEIRKAFFQSGSAPSIFGVTLHKLQELGDNKKYSALFDTYFSAAGGTFATTDQILIGLDLTRSAFIRPVSVESEVGSSVAIQVDDQFTAREDKMGWYAKIEEGRLALDAKAIIGLKM